MNSNDINNHSSLSIDEQYEKICEPFRLHASNGHFNEFIVIFDKLNGNGRAAFDFFREQLKDLKKTLPDPSQYGYQEELTLGGPGKKDLCYIQALNNGKPNGDIVGAACSISRKGDRSECRLSVANTLPNNERAAVMLLNMVSQFAKKGPVAFSTRVIPYTVADQRVYSWESNYSPDVNILEHHEGSTHMIDFSEHDILAQEALHYYCGANARSLDRANLYNTVDKIRESLQLLEKGPLNRSNQPFQRDNTHTSNIR
jgi:hypothetical protein